MFRNASLAFLIITSLVASRSIAESRDPGIGATLQCNAAALWDLQSPDTEIRAAAAEKFRLKVSVLTNLYLEIGELRITMMKKSIRDLERLELVNAKIAAYAEMLKVIENKITDIEPCAALIKRLVKNLP